MIILELGISTRTTLDWRSMSSKVLEHWVGCQKPIGAEAVVVEIDKSLVQQIYNQGRILSQVWVLRG